ncbi:MAG: hypothetical protein BWX79_01310 [Alphaproteobacteria bacterium ADurb.Bin100]|nr:MAG: hypothetical protein BWX79_01310 [Alphaproteobacteria bacterium ADurb.Bin100]
MSQKDATVIAREIQDMAQAMAESMTSVAETVKAAVAVTHGQARGEAGQIVQLSTPAPVLQLPPPQIDVHVNVPEQLPPVINLPPTELTVNAPVAVNVPPAIPQAYEVQVTSRDAQGMIKTFLIVPVVIE